LYLQGVGRSRKKEHVSWSGDGVGLVFVVEVKGEVASGHQPSGTQEKMLVVFWRFAKEEDMVKSGYDTGSAWSSIKGSEIASLAMRSTNN
jgi:hypothetical protein